MSLRIGRALNRLRVRGAGEIFALARERATGWIASEDALLMLVRSTESEERSSAGLRFREATAMDAARYASEIGTDSAASFTRRLDASTHCFVVEDEDNGRLFHASWLTTSAAWTREIGAYLAPPDGGAYIYESFTGADARGRGIYPLALAGMVTWCARHDIERCWVAVEEGNTPSRRAIDKAGFEEAFVIPFSRRWGRVRIGTVTGPQAEAGEGFIHTQVLPDPPAD